MSTLGYGWKQGLKNIWQNRLFSLAAIGTIATCLFMFGLFYVLISNFRNMVYSAESNVGLTVFFKEGISERQIAFIGEEIKACEDVEEVKYISAEEAWKNFKKEMYAADDEIEDTFGEDNPLENSASYEVYLKDVSNQNGIIHLIEKIEGVRKVNGSSVVANGLSRFNMLVTYVSVTVIVLLLLISVFLIHTAVATGIRVRSNEISIMKYIGATDMFVRLPFVVEGMVIGVIGAMIPLVILRMLYERLIAFILSHFSVISQWLTFVPLTEEFRVLIPVSLLVGAGIGFVGSMVSVRKHIRRADA